VVWVAVAIIVAIAAFIAGSAFLLAWRTARRTQSVVTTLADATADESCLAAAPGLTYSIREQLLEAIPAATSRLRREIHRAAIDETSPIHDLVIGELGASVLDDLADPKDNLGELGNTVMYDLAASQRELSESLASIAPESARGILRLSLETLLRQRGVRISGVSQRVSDDPGRIGISLTVSDLRGNYPWSRITIWEDEKANVAGSPAVQRLHALTRPVSRALACELIRQHLMEQQPRQHFRGRIRTALRHQSSQATDRSSVIDFIIGLLYQTGARRYPRGTTSFYRLSGQALRRAKPNLEHYMCAYLLGATLGEQARRTDDSEAGALFRESVDLFEEALIKLEAAQLSPAQQHTEYWKIQASLVTNWWLLANGLAKTRTSGGFVLMMRPYNCRS
jgi:hypothetical protein